MSLRDYSAKLFRGLVIAIVAASTAACFKPLYADVGGSGGVSAKLASIEVMSIKDKLGQERIGYYVQQELRFDLDGKIPIEKRYRLEMTLTEALQSPIVDTATGRADAATITGDVTYVLKEIISNTVLTGGKATSSATYDRNPQRFASIRGARDAEIRVAKQISDQIRLRLSAYISSRE